MRRTWGDRPGVTLIELAVVLALVGIAGGAIGVTLVRQQRFYRGASDLLGARGSVRDALEVISTDLRGMAVVDTPTLMADSAFEFFANIGSAIVCRTTAASEVGVAGSVGARGNVLTSLLVQPDTGDLAVFYKVGPDGADGWERARISSFAQRQLSSSCPDATAFSVGDGGKGYVVVLAAPLVATTRQGMPVRFIRRGRYSLYRAGDGDWYLGYRRCNAIGPPSCGAVQPLSGPYRAHSPNRAVTGLLFEYFDAAGNPIDRNGASSLALVRITARAGDGQTIGRGDWLRGDSSMVAIAVRNKAP